MSRDTKKAVGWLLALVVLFLVLNDARRKEPQQLEEPARDRYTWSGDKINPKTGLTNEQYARIVIHCAEKPHAWDC